MGNEEKVKWEKFVETGEREGQVGGTIGSGGQLGGLTQQLSFLPSPPHPHPHPLPLSPPIGFQEMWQSLKTLPPHSQVAKNPKESPERKMEKEFDCD